MYHVYILRSLKTNKYYIGSTGHLEDRINRHNSKRSIATKRGYPWQLIFIEQYSTRSQAYRREMQIKSFHGGEAFKKLIN